MTWPVSMHNMTKRFGERTILDQVTLTIRPGETAALIGPSGGGKSTLLRCLNGLNTFDGGAVQVGPHRLGPGPGNSRRDIQHVRRSFGLIFQDFQLFPHRNVMDNVTEAPIRVLGLPVREAQERALKLLERVGMADFARVHPQQLSGGQKQRVAIARALAMEPRGLLCDEITSALDPELKHEVLNVIEDLKRDGLTIILVTHEIGFARRAADRVVMLDGGRIVEEGTPAEVFDRPKTERMALFLKRVMA